LGIDGGGFGGMVLCDRLRGGVGKGRVLLVIGGGCWGDGVLRQVGKGGGVFPGGLNW
jgi:hypothetical protein